MGSHTKGTVLLGTIRFLRESFGDEGLQKIYARLDSEERERLESPFLPSVWYPLSFLLNIMRSAKAEFGASVPDLYSQMGRASADFALSSVYSMVFKISSTQWIISRAAVVFASYYDTGKMGVVENGKGFAILEVSNFAEPAPELCERIRAWCGRVLEQCGEKTVKVEHIQCRCRGDSICRFSAKWR
jgi:predicted hydrocarbon binding protein